MRQGGDPGPPGGRARSLIPELQKKANVLLILFELVISLLGTSPKKII